MIKVIHIVGNRPQFIKLWVLHSELSKQDNIQQYIVHSGQHSSREMNGIFFEKLQIPQPDYTLSCDSSINSSDDFIAICSKQLQELFLKFTDAIAFTYGDTNTTLAAAIAAKRTNTVLHHFEAGVRTGEMSMPEEINRILTDRLADVNYCCTKKNYNTLLDEGYSTSIKSEMFLTGDLMLDAFKKAENIQEKTVSKEKYIAATCHRADNIQNSAHLNNIIDAMNTIHKQIPVKMALHPHTQKKINEFGIRPLFDIVPALDYMEMQRFIQNSTIVVTDSGGVSREAFFAQKPSLIIMKNPFWKEIVDAGCSINTKPEKLGILEKFEKVQQLQPDFTQPIFGDGNAAKNILKIISRNIGQD